jgi:uncharacterized protein (DUF2126 family)
MDSSSQRIELVIRPASGKALELGNWELAINGVKFQPAHATDAQGEAQVAGLRYRAFVPQIGLHPTVPAQTPLTLTLIDPTRAAAFTLVLHEWNPTGAAYDGLPRDEAEAARRRYERVVISPTAYQPSVLPAPPPGALSPWCLDLRRC